MVESLDIGAMIIADKVSRHVMANYYTLLLDALQLEADRLGYFFAQSDTGAIMLPTLNENLAWKVRFRRICYLYPNLNEDWCRLVEEGMSDGSAKQFLRAMLAALAALGIRLQGGPDVCSQLEEEECRLREKSEWLPAPAPAPPTDDGISCLASEFFAWLELREPKDGVDAGVVNGCADELHKHANVTGPLSMVVKNPL